MRGLVGYGVHLPHHRLERAAIGAVMGTGGGPGTRAVASFDEDTTSMGVEAARRALRRLGGVAIERLHFATASPAYVDKTNAAAVHAALRLPRSCLAVDAGGAVRSWVGAFLAAAEARVPAVAVCSDLRTGNPGSADERDSGDGAVAFVFADDSHAPVLAEVLGHGAATEEFLHRWRLPGALVSRTWEERFGEHVYVPLAEAALTDALAKVGLAPGSIDHLVVAGVSSRAARGFVQAAGIDRTVVADDLVTEVGNTGTAHAGIVLAEVLDRAAPGQVVVVVTLADGASAVVLRTTEAVTHRSTAPGVRAQIAAGDAGLAYATFLSWKGMLDREPPRRPDPVPPAAPPAHRREDWKFALVAARCESCGIRNVPPGRVCLGCGAVDRMVEDPLAAERGTVANFTVDRLAHTPSPPLVSAVVDFDGGGRLRCELTDVDPAQVAVGDRVEMTFRRMFTAGGVHNYFWKARPCRAEPDADVG